MKSPQATRRIDQIKVGIRHRKDFGDLPAFAAEIDAVGLLHPIVITPRNELIAGERRLRAWPLTKFKDDEIPVHVVPLKEIARGEWSENAQRKDFTPSETVAIKRALEPEMKEAAKERRRLHGGTAPGRKASESNDEHSGEIPHSVPARAADQVAAFTGRDRRTIDKAEAIVKAAEAEPVKYGALVADMDRTGRVNGPFKRLRVMKASEAIRKEPPPLPGRGPYRCIVIDPPWASEPGEVPAGRAYFPYPTMSVEQLCALDIASIAHADTVLWLWTTNFHMPHAFTLLQAWGFEHKTIRTWVKNKMGQGQLLRGQTEHVILATRGNPTIHLTNQTTFFHAAVREHSQKPEKFYTDLEAMCPAPRYAELFSRRKLPENWDGHGDEVKKRAATAAETPGASVLLPEGEGAERSEADEGGDLDAQAPHPAAPRPPSPNGRGETPDYRIPPPSDDELDIPAFLKRPQPLRVVEGEAA